MARVALVGFAAVLMTGASLADVIKIPVSIIELGWMQEQCQVPIGDEERSAGALSDGLQLVMVPCWRAAYNFGWLVFAVDPKAPGDAQQLRLPDWTLKGIKSTAVVVTPDYDETKRTLTSVSKGRGVGDCGTISEWKWSGKDFKLVSVLQKEKCDGQAFEAEKRWQVYPARR